MYVVLSKFLGLNRLQRSGHRLRRDDSRMGGMRPVGSHTGRGEGALWREAAARQVAAEKRAGWKRKEIGEGTAQKRAKVP